MIYVAIQQNTIRADASIKEQSVCRKSLGATTKAAKVNQAAVNK